MSRESHLQHEKNIRQLMRKRYITALSVIALIISLSVLSMQFLIADQEGDAELINTAGIQRMLSQKVALHVNQLRTSSLQQQSFFLEKIRHSLKRFEANHQFLLHSIQKKSSSGAFSYTEVRALYFSGQEPVDPLVNAYVQQVRDIIASEQPQQAAARFWSDEQLEVLLLKLDLVVEAFEQSAARKVSFISYFSLGLWLIAILALVAEVFAIFLPMERGIRSILEKLELKKDEAQRANDAKSQFLANMSHELRTPLNGIFGLLEVVQTESDKIKRNKHVLQTKKMGRQLLNIINDILDVAKIESNHFGLENKDFELLKMLENCIAPYAVLSDKKKLNFSFKCVNELPQWVNGDPDRLTQLFNNLLSNALKFTHKGCIDVLCDTKFVGGKHILTLSVLDTGVGIPEDKLDAVFEKFTQADNSSTRQFDGTGLGLAISKELVNLMQGTISLKSQQNRGTRIEVNIPLALPRNQHQAEEVEQAGVFSCVVIDDLQITQNYMKHLLLKHGIQAQLFSNGNDFLEQLDVEDAPQVIFVDLHMPGMTGFELVEILQKQYPQLNLHFVLVTADGLELDPDSPELEAFSYLLAKPVDETRFHEVIELLIQSMQTSSCDTSAENMRVLVAEDNDLNAEILTYMLEEQGCVVTRVENGQRAVSIMDDEEFDLIMMDINMPIMDGLEASQCIKQKSDIPIVAVSANAYEEDRIRAMKVGINEYLAKPVDKEHLVNVLCHYKRH